MGDSVLYQAVVNITSFGQKPSSPTEEQHSTQYTDTFDGIPESELPPTQTKEPTASSEEDGVHPKEAALEAAPPSLSTLTTKDANTMPGLSHSAPFLSAPVPFTRLVDTTLASGFSFGKATKIPLNIQPTRGPAAVLQKKNEQQIAFSNTATNVDSGIPSTVAKATTTSQLAHSSQDSSSSNATPMPEGNLDLQQANVNLSIPSSQQVLKAEQDPANKTRETAAAAEPHEATSYCLTLEDLPTTAQIAATGGSHETQHPTEELSLSRSTTADETSHDVDATMLDGPTLANDSPASRSISQTSSRFSSVSPFQGKRIRSSCRTLSNQSPSPDSSDGSALYKLQTASKIKKRRGSPRHSSFASPKDLSALAATRPEEILEALMIHHQHQKQEQAQRRAEEKKREEDNDNAIEEYKIIIEDLDSKLNSSEKRMSKQEVELLQFRQLVPKWQDRVKKLGDFVKGLSNDHTRLRDDARAIQGEQQKIRVHKEAVDKLLEEAVNTLKTERAEHQNCLSKAYHRAEIAEQALSVRNADLLNESTRLRAEEGKSASLQDSLNKITLNDNEILTKLADQEVTLSSKIANLGKTTTDLIRDTSTSGQKYLYPRIEECIALLKEPRSINSVNAEDVQKLDVSIKENAAQISRLASICQGSINTTSHLENRLASELESRFQRLMSSIEAGRPLEPQMQDLREIKATITERLRATEVELIESRHKLNAAEDQDKAHLQKIAALEAEVNTLRSQPQESLSMALHLHDSQKKCEKVSKELSAYQLQLEDARHRQEVKSAEKADLELLLEAAKAEVAGLQATVDNISLEKAAVEDQAKANEDRLKERFTKTCQDEIARTTNKFLNDVHRLRNAEKDLKASRAETVLAEASRNEALAKLDIAMQNLQKEQSLSSDVTQLLEKSRREHSQLEEAIVAIGHHTTEKNNHLGLKEAEIQQLRERMSNIQKDLETDKQVIKQLEIEKSSANRDAQRAEVSANDSHRLSVESQMECSQLKQEIATSRDQVAMTGRELHSMKAERDRLLANNHDTTLWLNEAKAENAQLREQIKDSEDALASADQELGRQEARIQVLLQEQTTAKDKPTPGGSTQPCSASKSLTETKAVGFPASAQEHCPGSAKKAVVVEDSQNRGSIIEDSQHQRVDPLPRQNMADSTDAMNSSNPIAFMPKAIQDLVAVPSSPLADCQPTSPPVTNERVISPRPNQGRQVEDSQAAGMSSQDLGNSYGSPIQRTIWASSTTTTKTKSHSVERSVARTSSSTGDRVPYSHLNGNAPLPSSSAKRTTNAQLSQQPPGILKSGGSKRLRTSQPRSSDSQDGIKRRRMSTEISIPRELPDLGPTKTSPVKPVGTSRRKSSLRRPQKGDKYHDRFIAELEKE
ncbi:MAG: hypothetical protein Q9209_007398 [Squamulea sp. 1 TL-2023]